MSSKRVNAIAPEAQTMNQMGRRALLSLMGLAASTVACASTSPRRGASKPKRRHVDAVELLPGDLDAVLRIDLARMRAALGPITQSLSTRVGSEVDVQDELATKAIERARVVWIGTRLTDMDTGDRVLIIEGDVEDLRPDPVVFHVVDPPLSDDVKTFERKGPLSRNATARIHLLGARTIVFVSSVEADGVERILRQGADPDRRDPPADGLLSADVRGRRLPPQFERRFPSIGSIVRGINRARASVTMVDEGVKLDIEVTNVSTPASRKLEGFLSALREGGQGSRYATLFDGLSVERIEQAVRVKWIVPIEMIQKLIEA